MAIAEGQAAPPFALPDATGAIVSLADFRGQHVILYFYPRDHTPGCTKEACGFRDLWDEIRGTGAVVLGVSPDEPGTHAAFAAKHRLPFRLLSDPGHRVLQDYEAWGEKMLYGRKTTGVIRSTVWIAEDGRVRKHWPRVRDAAAHAASVLDALCRR